MEICIVEDCSSDAVSFYYIRKSIHRYCKIHSESSRHPLRNISDSLTQEEISTISIGINKLKTVQEKLSSAIPSYFSAAVEDSLRETCESCDLSISLLQECLDSERAINMLKNELLQELYEITPKDEMLLNRYLLKSILTQNCLSSPLIAEIVRFIDLKLEKSHKFSYFFFPFSKSLQRIDLEYNTKETLNFDTFPSMVDSISGMSRMSDNDLIYCGRLNGTGREGLVNRCLIMNPFTFEYQMLPDMLHAYGNVLPIVTGDHIYIFGEKTITINEFFRPSRYCLKYNCWEEIPPMPVTSSFIYPVLGIDCILLAGKTTHGVFAYHIISQTYTKVLKMNKDDSAMRADMDCALVGDEYGNLFYFYDKKIYESSIFNHFSWKKVGKYRDYLDYPRCIPHIFNGNIYLTTTKGCFKFDPLVKTMELVILKRLN